jgi:hypothetical protein
MVGVPRIKAGKRQSIETLINEEALMFVKYLRNKRKEWDPRTPSFLTYLCTNVALSRQFCHLLGTFK